MSSDAPLTFEAAPDGAPSSLTPIGTIPLPFAVGTAAYALDVQGSLHAWINDPSSGRSQHVTLTSTDDLTLQAPVPLVLAGVAECRGTLVATGSDRDGRPAVIGLAAGGGESWRHLIDGPAPTRWPVPLCPSQASVAWQSRPGRLEVAHVGVDGLTGRRSIPVDGPAVEVAAAGGNVWCVWVEPTGIRGVASGADAVQGLHIRVPAPGSVAIATCGSGICVAWESEGRASFARLTSDGELAERPSTVDLGEAAGGRIAVVPGPSPIVWVQRLLSDDAGPPRWVSALARPGGGTLMVDGPIHAATTWRDRLVLVGTVSLHLLAIESVAPSGSAPGADPPRSASETRADHGARR
jgi:hypothetical protein